VQQQQQPEASATPAGGEDLSGNLIIIIAPHIEL